MEIKQLLGFVIVLQLALNVVACYEYVYEFGHKEYGQQIFETDGHINFFSYNNYYTVQVPSNMQVNYVIVTVDALAPPKVEYDNQSKTVSIKYSLFEVTYSKYRIVAKGVQSQHADSTSSQETKE